MENTKGYRRASQPRFLNPKQRRSGYEPSDTETEWDERNRNNSDLGFENPDLGSSRSRNKMPSRSKTRALSRPEDEPLARNWDLDQSRNKITGRSSSRYEDEALNEIGLRVGKAHLGPDKTRNKSYLKQRKLHSTKFDDDSSLVGVFKGSLPTRMYNTSPHKPTAEYTPLRNVSPFAKTEACKNVSPYKPVRQGYDFVNSGSIKTKRLENYRQINNVKDKRGGSDQIIENSRVSEKSYYSHRSQSAPKSIHGNPSTGIKERDCSHKNIPPAGILNELVASAKISRTCPTNFESTESISQGDIFFSKEYTTMNMAMQKNLYPNKDNGRNDVPHQSDELIENRIYKHKISSPTSVTARTSMASNSFLSRQSSDKLSTTNSSKLSVMSTSTERFVLSRKKNQAEVWLSCLKRGTCKTLKSSEKVNEFDEATFIEKAFVDEIPRQFWADKHQPASLDDFTCHKQEAQLLKQLVSHDICPNILLKGPRGSGKKALVMALLHKIYGDSAHNVSHELRYFNSQESTPIQVVVPSSAHHVELNAYTEPNIKHALISLVKDISRSFVTSHEISIAVERKNYKVIVLYDVDKATQRIQHLMKWIMDGYTESCKLILCCEDDKGILDSVKDRCKLVTVDAPLTHEITEVLNQIARKEQLDLPMNFATKIANKSRQNLRHTIMALEACKVHNYPFVDDQPIPIGWEEIVEDLAAEILADPSHTRIFSIRGRFQKLLVEFVHPKLILQGLVKQFLKSVNGRSKRELYYWHAYYEKRLPTGSRALLKLEEFVAKFMSMHRRGTLFNSNIPSLTRRQ